jgi:hypothetical protein
MIFGQDPLSGNPHLTINLNGPRTLPNRNCENPRDLVSDLDIEGEWMIRILLRNRTAENEEEQSEKGV